MMKKDGATIVEDKTKKGLQKKMDNHEKESRDLTEIKKIIEKIDQMEKNALKYIHVTMAPMYLHWGCGSGEP